MTYGRKLQYGFLISGVSRHLWRLVSSVNGVCHRVGKLCFHLFWTQNLLRSLCFPRNDPISCRREVGHSWSSSSIRLFPLRRGPTAAVWAVVRGEWSRLGEKRSLFTLPSMRSLLSNFRHTFPHEDKYRLPGLGCDNPVWKFEVMGLFLPLCDLGSFLYIQTGLTPGDRLWVFERRVIHKDHPPSRLSSKCSSWRLYKSRGINLLQRTSPRLRSVLLHQSYLTCSVVHEEKCP